MNTRSVWILADELIAAPQPSSSRKREPMIFSMPNVHALPWTPNNTSAGIDPKLADSIFCDNRPDAMTVTIASKTPDSGALCSLNLPVPLVDGLPLPYLRVIWGVYPSKTAVRCNRVYETDAILVWPPALASESVPGQWYDGSFQANQVEGASQIDKVASTDPATGKITYAWSDLPSNIGYQYLADHWNPATVDYHYDFTAKTTSVIAVDGVLTPPTMQKVPANLNNWSRTVPGQPHQPLLKLQAQLHTMVAAGYSVDYTCSVLWSDNASFV